MLRHEAFPNALITVEEATRLCTEAGIPARASRFFQKHIDAGSIRAKEGMVVWLVKADVLKVIEQIKADRGDPVT